MSLLLTRMLHVKAYLDILESTWHQCLCSLVPGTWYWNISKDGHFSFDVSEAKASHCTVDDFNSLLVALTSLKTVLQYQQPTYDSDLCPFIEGEDRDQKCE